MSSITELYLREHDGFVSDFHENIRKGQRLGQAFFNALSSKDQERLRGTSRDPFNYDGAMAELKITWAIELLLGAETYKEEL